MSNVPPLNIMFKSYDERLQENEREIRTLRSEVAGTSAYQKNLYKQFEKLDSSINDKVDGAVRAISNKVDEIKGDLGELKGKVVHASSRIDNLENNLKERSAWNEMYRKGFLILLGAAAPPLIQWIVGLLS